MRMRLNGLHGRAQVIIFLYLLEEETSYVVLFSSFLGLLIEFWKLTQAMSISLDFSGPYPRLKFADKSSYTCARPHQSQHLAARPPWPVTIRQSRHACHMLCRHTKAMASAHLRASQFQGFHVKVYLCDGLLSAQRRCCSAGSVALARAAEVLARAAALHVPSGALQAVHDEAARRGGDALNLNQKP